MSDIRFYPSLNKQEPFTDYRWEPTGNKPLIECVNCGGEYEELRVVPDRSPAYLRKILLCRNCKGIFGFPRRRFETAFASRMEP